MQVRTDADLARVMKSGTIPPLGDVSEQDRKAIESNHRLATDCLGSISVLRKTEAFAWFERECLQKALAEAEATLKNPQTPDAELATARKLYLKVKEIADWLNDREATYRESIKPDDPQIPILRQRIGLQ